MTVHCSLFFSKIKFVSYYKQSSYYRTISYLDEANDKM